MGFLFSAQGEPVPNEIRVPPKGLGNALSNPIPPSPQGGEGGGGMGLERAFPSPFGVTLKGLGRVFKGSFILIV